MGPSLAKFVFSLCLPAKTTGHLLLIHRGRTCRVKNLPPRDCNRAFLRVGLYPRVQTNPPGGANLHGFRSSKYQSRPYPGELTHSRAPASPYLYPAISLLARPIGSSLYLLFCSSTYRVGPNPLRDCHPLRLALVLTASLFLFCSLSLRYIFIPYTPILARPAVVVACEEARGMAAEHASQKGNDTGIQETRRNKNQNKTVDDHADTSCAAIELPLTTKWAHHIHLVASQRPSRAARCRHMRLYLFCQPASWQEDDISLSMTTNGNVRGKPAEETPSILHDAPRQKKMGHGETARARQ